ncbi:hypothetical protein NHH03_19510 [Stieleria sp. TO1_6]|nr:hypothetical protein [Stieleria tagensis]
MIRLLAVALTLLSFSPAISMADDVVPSRHSTVHVVFVAPLSQQAMRGGLMTGTESMVRVGDTILPGKDVRPIEIRIDGDFVGHALVGNWDVKPVFVLPEGVRKFTFTREGSDPIPAEIKVLGTGSTQYLIVKLKADQDAKPPVASSKDASGDQPFGN